MTPHEKPATQRATIPRPPQLITTGAEWAGAVAVRLAVFCIEQHVSMTLELDRYDHTAIHAVTLLPSPLAADDLAQLKAARLGLDSQATRLAAQHLPAQVVAATGARSDSLSLGALAPVIGTARLLQHNADAPGVLRIGRVAVLPRWRRQGVGRHILQMMEAEARARGARRVLLHAQVQAQSFYFRQGYRPDRDGAIFMEDGIPHVSLSKPVAEAPTGIQLAAARTSSTTTGKVEPQ